MRGFALVLACAGRQMSLGAQKGLLGPDEPVCMDMCKESDPDSW